MKKSKLVVAALTVAMLAAGGAIAGCSHKHTYSEDWKKDATGHWHAATCDDLKEGDKDYTKDYAEHVWGNDDECDVCHYIRTPAAAEYTVTLNVGDGSLADGVETTLTTVNGKLATLPTPTAPANKKFDGWYTAATGGTKVTTDYTFTGDTKTVTIYAVYVDDATAPVTTVELNMTELKLSIGNLEAELTATVSGGGTVTWSSDNPDVVAVNEETGYVEAIKPGAATITATVVGGEASATCEVTVDGAYYLIGGQDPDWNKVGVFGQSGVIYFMPTETEGIYKTESTELPRLGNFQVAPVGDTSGNWWQKAFNGDYIAAGDTVLSRNSDGNIAVEKHGKYTITLDLTGDRAVVSGVCDQIIDDGEVEEVYYLIGTVNNWTLAADGEAAGEYAFTKNADGTYSLTANLEKGELFKIAIAGMAWNGALNTGNIADGKIANAVTDEVQLIYGPSDYNIQTGVAGEYVFTITVVEGTATVDYTCTPSEEPDTPEFIDGGAYLVGRGFSTTDFGLNKDFYIDPENGLEVTLTVGNLFKIVYCKSDAPDWDTIPTYEMAEGKEEGYLNLPGSNGTVKVTGKYTITMVTDGDSVKFVFTPDAALEPDLTEPVLHYFIKGAKVTNNWGEPRTEEYELKETEEGSGIYTMTIVMEAADQFMFYGINENKETGEMQAADKYIQYGQLADGVTCVTNQGVNFLTKDAGTYTFTFNASTNKLAIEFTAAETGETGGETTEPTTPDEGAE